MTIHATLQQLRLFDAVARHGNVTRAAEEIHLTQPAVSIQVRRLEEKIGMPLLEQVGKRLHKTASGEKVHEACRDVLDRLDNLENALEELRETVAGPLKVTVVSPTKYFLPYLLGDFIRLHPRVEPQLQITNRAKLLTRLNANEDDLYIMGRVPDDLDVISQPFLNNELVVVARPDHTLCQEGTISLHRLAEERMVGREPGSGTRKSVEQMFEHQGLSVTLSVELDSTEAIKQGVIGGLGFGVLPLHSIRLEMNAGVLKVLNVEGFPLHRQWFAVHRRGKHLSKAAHTFMEYLLEKGEERVKEIEAGMPNNTRGS